MEWAPATPTTLIAFFSASHPNIYGPHFHPHPHPHPDPRPTGLSFAPPAASEFGWWSILYAEKTELLQYKLSTTHPAKRYACDSFVNLGRLPIIEIPSAIYRNCCAVPSASRFLDAPVPLSNQI